MDFGCLYDHYVSDMTRTIYLGHVSDEQAEIYNTVLKANQALIDQAKAGLGFRDFDKIPRDIIIEQVMATTLPTVSDTVLGWIFMRNHTLARLLQKLLRQVWP